MIRDINKFRKARARRPNAERNDYWTPDKAARRDAESGLWSGFRNHQLIRVFPTGRSRWIPAGEYRNVPEGNR
jgi:hypothetical protein